MLDELVHRRLPPRRGGEVEGDEVCGAPDVGVGVVQRGGEPQRAVGVFHHGVDAAPDLIRLLLVCEGSAPQTGQEDRLHELLVA